MPGESEEKSKRKEIEEKKALLNKQKTLIVPKSDNNLMKFRKAETMVDTLNQKNQNKMNVERPSKNHLTSLPTFHFNSNHFLIFIGQSNNIKKNSVVFSPLKPLQPVNPLEIQDEDKIFDDFNRNALFCRTEVGSPELEHHNQGERLVSLLQTNKYRKRKVLSQNDKILSNVYKITPEFQSKINRAKRKKKSLDLRTYQTNLINTLSNNVSKIAIERLERKFHKIRTVCDKYYETNFDFIKAVEASEEQIIKRINYEGNMCQRMMNTTGKFFRQSDTFCLPKIKFYKVILKDPKRNTFYVRSNRKKI